MQQIELKGFNSWVVKRAFRRYSTRFAAMAQNKLHGFFFTRFTVPLNLTGMNKSKYA